MRNFFVPLKADKVDHKQLHYLGSGLDGGDRQIIYGNEVCESNDCSGMSDKIFYQYDVLQKYPTDRFW